MARGINRGHQRKQELRENAAILTEERAKRTPKQQLALLDERLGEGKGARKERAKLIIEPLPKLSAKEKKKLSKRRK